MYVIGRKAGESIWIGDTKLVVLKVGKGRIRLGLESTPGTRIMRGECVPPAAPTAEATLEKPLPDGRAIA